MSRVFSGVKPSGEFHLGNYVGALQNWVRMQDDHECIFCVVDLHAITVPQDPKELRDKTLEIVAFYLACGIDSKKNILFVQSHVPQHAQLAWLLNTVAKMSELRLMHQYKEKSIGKEENISVGLFDYPVLMAADILLYQAEIVPVGEDQMQHIELVRELARRFNNRFGETFTLPQGMIQKIGNRIMSLDDPTKKMSKSSTSSAGYISMSDTPETIRKKIKRAVTDSGSEVVFQGDKPALSNLLTIYHTLSGIPIKKIEAQYAGRGYGDFKKDLAEVIIETLAPIQKKYSSYIKEKKTLLDILADGRERAGTIAEKTYRAAHEKVGLL